MSVRKNTVYNLLGSVIPLAVSLVTIPIYLGLIGEARYGVLAIAWLLLGYFGLFDLGLGRATAQRIAALRDGTDAERAQTFWTALTLNVGLGAIGGLLIWPIATYFFGHVFKIEDVLRPEMQAAVPWLVLAVPMATLSGVLSGALQGRQKFLELNVISVFGAVLFQLLPLLAAIGYGADLRVVLPAALFARLITLLILFERCRKYLVCGHAATFLRTQAGQLLRFGGWVTVTSVISPMMIVLDRFIIGNVLGARAVSYYTVPFQLADRSGIVPVALTSALFPRFVTASPEEEQRLVNQSLLGVMVIMTPIMAIAILLIEPFLSWWITPSFANEAGLVGRILLIAYWINAFATIPYAQLQARGRPDIVAKCNLLELLPYFWLLYVGLNRYGLVGAAMAFTIRILADFTLLAGFAGILRRALRLLTFPALSIGVATMFSLTLEFSSREWFAMVGVYVLFGGIWAWKKAPDLLRTVVLNQINKIIRPVRVS